MWCLASLLLLARPALAQTPDSNAGASRPNLLLVTLDTTRADRFAAWGGDQGVTPAADRLAASGVVFERAVAAAPTTSPSHASMLSGLETARHGVRTNKGVLPETVATVTEQLRAAGYATGAFTSVRFLLIPSGLSRGFAIADAPPRRVKVRPAAATTKRAVEWLRSLEGDRPFFAWVHYFDAHSPYELTPWAHQRLGDYRGPVQGTVSVADFGLGHWMDDPEDTRAIRARYDGLVNRADAALARLLAALGEAGLRKRTIVIVAADHGQALGEHRRPGHEGMWESILHVPLIIAGPGVAGPRRVRERVGLVDLAPTLLELAELPTAGGAGDLDGRSLAPALRGEPLPQRAYVSRRQRAETSRTPLEQAVIEKRRQRIDSSDYDTAVYWGDLKVLDGGSGTAVFDVEKDPDESRPIDAGSPATGETAVLRELLDAARDRADGEPEVGRVPDATLEALRALGYTE